jgi:hypothetical protein
MTARSVHALMGTLGDDLPKAESDRRERAESVGPKGRSVLTRREAPC